MQSLNQVSLIGNLGRAPEGRTTNGGDPVVTFSMATTDRWKDKDSGEQKEKTEWHRVVVFGGLCEIASKYLKKGSPVFIQGRLKTREWTDKEDVKRWSTEIVLSGLSSRLTLLEKAPPGDRPPEPPPSTNLDDEIPF